MTTLKSFAMVAALLAGGTSLALAQNTPSVTGGAAANPSQATKHDCVTVRQGIVECHNTKQMAANANSASEKAPSPASATHGTDTATSLQSRGTKPIKLILVGSCIPRRGKC